LIGCFSKKQTLDDAYAIPANFLEIDVINPITHGVGSKRYTDYEVRMKVTKELQQDIFF
jgi:sorting nexin-3/12